MEFNHSLNIGDKRLIKLFEGVEVFLYSQSIFTQLNITDAPVFVRKMPDNKVAVIRRLRKSEWTLSVLMAIFVVLAGSFEFVHAATDAPPSQQQVIMRAAGDFTLTRALLVAAVIVLMGVLFFVVFIWQRQIEESGYFADILSETVEKIEFDRRALQIHKLWARGAYPDELLGGITPRAKEWRRENPMPEADGGLRSQAEELDSYGRIDAIEAAMKRGLSMVASQQGGYTNLLDEPVPRYGLTAFEPVPTYSSTGSGLERDTEAEKTPEFRNKQKDFEDKLKQFKIQAKQWTEKAGACVADWYNKDLEQPRKAARKSAKKALRVDLSALRGRGPEFVLEFTAIVVIIFAAVILGIGSVLDSNQIGTLLAAIAGYVLGKAASRSPSASAEEQPARDKTGVPTIASE